MCQVVIELRDVRFWSEIVIMILNHLNDFRPNCTPLNSIAIINYLMFISFQSPCSSYPCQNAAACGTNNRYNTFECFCENGFTGKYYEKGNTVEHISNEYITISLPTNYKNLTK